MQPRHFEAITFSAKAALSAVVAALAYEALKLPGAPWVAAVSAVLVTQPSLPSSVKVSLLRIVANLFGAFGGAALSIVIGQPLVAMAIGVMATGVVCYLLNQNEALRPAFVAVVIVTLIGESGKWHSSLDRVIAVAIGCGCALAMGFVFDNLAARFSLPAKDEGKNLGSPE